MTVAYFWSWVASVLVAPMEYKTEIAASRLLKSRSQVELNSTGSDQVILALATSGDLVTLDCGGLEWVRLRKIRHKMM